MPATGNMTETELIAGVRVLKTVLACVKASHSTERDLSRRETILNVNNEG